MLKEIKLHLTRIAAICFVTFVAVAAYAGENDLKWDYTEKAPSKNPDNGLYYASKVDDNGKNNNLKGIKLNSSGYAFFAKPAVAGKLTLTAGLRSGSGKFGMKVYACTIADGQATKGDIIAETAEEDDLHSSTVEIKADVAGIYIERKTGAEGVLTKIEFKETVARQFTDFEMVLGGLAAEFDTSTLPQGVTFSGTYNNDTHGYRNATVTVPVDGTVKFTIGGCQYANRTFTVTNKAGETLATIDPKTAKCYHEDKSSVNYIYTGAADVLTFNNIQYLPYFKAVATEVSEVTVTYKDQNGKTLGTKKLFEGDALGEVPYSESDLTIAEGYAFRGWVYSNGVKVKPSDPVNGNITVSASVTAIESVSVGSIQVYDLASNIFYAEDHETFGVQGGAYHNNHGWLFAAGGSFSVDVAGKAQIVLTLCEYSDEGTLTVTDAAANILSTTVQAKAEKGADGANTIFNYDGEATRLTFTFGAKSYLHRISVYNVKNFLEKDAESGYYRVPKGDAASLILALNTASSEQGAKIFLEDGTYDLGTAVLTTVSGKNVSIIGQSAEKTIIVTTPPISKEGLGSADLLVNNGEGLYMQDLTLKNALDYYASGEKGRAPSLHDQGTKTICKNVRLLSYQDTYYSHRQAKSGGVFYFEGGELHGTVDYLCGNGNVYYNEVTLVNEKRSSATITANSDTYVFYNCTVENNANTYNLGRAWSDHPTCVYLNTTLKDPSKLAATRWNLTGINCDYKIAGEYGTKDASGNDITPAKNEVTFTKEQTKLNTILDATALTTYSIENVLGDWAATAQEEAAQVFVSNVKKASDGSVSWTAPIADGILMLTATADDGTQTIVRMGKLGTTLSADDINACIGDSKTTKLTLRAANYRGGFGPAVEVWTNKTVGIAPATAKANGNETVYTLSGTRTEPSAKGITISVAADGTAKKVIKK